MPPDWSYAEGLQQNGLQYETQLNPEDQQWAASTKHGHRSVQQTFGDSDPQTHTLPSGAPDPFDVSTWSQGHQGQPVHHAYQAEINDLRGSGHWRPMGQSPDPYSQPTPASIDLHFTPQQSHAAHPVPTITPHTVQTLAMYTPPVTDHSTPLAGSTLGDQMTYWSAFGGNPIPQPYPPHQPVPTPLPYPSPIDPGLTIAVGNGSTPGPWSAFSQFSTGDYLNLPQTASTVHVQSMPQHQLITHQSTPNTTFNPSPLSIPDPGVVDPLGAGSSSKREGRPNSGGLKRKLPTELSFSQSPRTLAPSQATATSSRSQSFSEGSQIIAKAPSRQPPLTARSLPARTQTCSPHIRPSSDASTAHQLNRQSPNAVDFVLQTAMSRIKSFNEDMTKILSSLPHDVLPQHANDDTRQQQAQLAELWNAVQIIQNACAKLSMTNQGGETAPLGILRQQQLASPFAASFGRMPHRNSIVSNASSVHSPRPPFLTPIGPEISAITMSHDITLWHSGASAPPPHQYPSVQSSADTMRDTTSSDPPGEPSFDKPLLTTTPLPLPQPVPESSATAPPAPDFRFGPWHQAEIDRLCHVWLTTKQEYLAKHGVDFIDWCGTIPEKLLTRKALMESPAHQYMVAMNAIARSRPGYVPPPPEIHDSPRSTEPILVWHHTQAPTSGMVSHFGDPPSGSSLAQTEVAPQAYGGGLNLASQKKYKVDEGINWTKMCEKMEISRSKKQVIFRAVEWGLKEKERRNTTLGKKQKIAEVKIEDMDANGPSLIQGIDISAIRARGNQEEIVNGLEEIKRRAAESLLPYESIRVPPPGSKEESGSPPANAFEEGTQEGAWKGKEKEIS